MDNETFEKITELKANENYSTAFNKVHDLISRFINENESFKVSGGSIDYIDAIKNVMRKNKDNYIIKEKRNIQEDILSKVSELEYLFRRTE